MRRILIIAAMFAVLAMPVLAQSQTAEKYKDRYDIMVGRLGAAGVGIETLLDKWAADYPQDPDMLLGRFAYYLEKGASEKIEKKDVTRYLGAEPLMTLTDSLGNPVYYFREVFYDDELFGKAMTAIDEAINLYPDRLDLRINKITALVAYEKESPDMAVSYLKGLIDYNASIKPAWVYPEMETSQELFEALVQEYCIAFYRYAVPGGYEAFRSVSERMLDYYPSNVLFIDNVGSYYLVYKEDYKTALKYYNKALKINKQDETAIKNCIILARKKKDKKMEAKYQKMLPSLGGNNK